jgi:hypothetical protein
MNGENKVLTSAASHVMWCCAPLLEFWTQLSHDTTMISDIVTRLNARPFLMVQLVIRA